MAKIRCKCGTVLWNGECPNDIQYWVYSDHKMEVIFENEIIDVTKLPEIADYEVWLCPDCKRLYLFQDGDNKVKYIYQLEEEITNEN
jgi:hypothetical protein